MRVIINPEFTRWKEFLESVPDIFESDGETIHTGRNTVKRFRTDDNVFIVKRYARINIIQRFIYTLLRPSKARRAYLYAGRFSVLGINTPKEVAYIEVSDHSLFDTGYFISLECDDTDLMHLSFNENFDKELASAFSSFLVELHSKNIYHGDLNLGNILYHTDTDGNYIFSVIDINRSRFGTLSRKACLDNMKRITHDRILLSYITSEYARIRNWNQEDTVRQMIDALERFEKLDTLKRKLKKKAGI